MKKGMEVSAGGVVYSRPPGGDESIEIVLASRRTRAGKLAWGLPKGLVDPGETIESAAVREVREETGLVAKIEASLGSLSYFYVWEGVRISKVVHFFLMRATGGHTSKHDDEMEDVEWFGASKAVARTSYPSERAMIEKALAML